MSTRVRNLHSNIGSELYVVGLALNIIDNCKQGLCKCPPRVGGRNQPNDEGWCQLSTWLWCPAAGGVDLSKSTAIVRAAVVVAVCWRCELVRRGSAVRWPVGVVVTWCVDERRRRQPGRTETERADRTLSPLSGLSSAIHHHLHKYNRHTSFQHTYCQTANYWRWRCGYKHDRSDVILRFLADHTNGRAYATVLHLSVVVCDVMFCG